MKKSTVHPIGLSDKGNAPYLSADIIPQRPILLSIPERLLLAFSTAILASSVAMGKPMGGLVGSVMLLCTVLLIFFRRGQVERRTLHKKYPYQEWGEDRNREIWRRLVFLQIIAWALVYLAAVSALLWGPKEGVEALFSWTAVGVFALVMVFFMPGVG